ncbi:hypothetical protein BGZ76_001142 [Entomortierella beljakovae]|nr:hypothetical protein BGZ76_001142 [Entomortierella beljakovae]
MLLGKSTKVIIVGGGIGGLVLAILLQRAGIDYIILERNVLIRPIGTILILSSLVLPLMEQLGMLKEIESQSLPLGGMTFLRDDHSPIGKIVVNDSKFVDLKERYGDYDQCILRSDFYNILLSRIPKDRLKLGKRVVNIQHIRGSGGNGCTQNSMSDSTPSEYSDRVMVRCSDGTYYYGEVLVGADGASSAVRQSLFRQLKEEGLLPKADQEEQQYRQVSLLGITNPQSSKKYPDLNEPFSNFRIVLNRNSPYMSWFMPVQGNKYCWLVTRTLETPVTINSGNSNLSDWGPDATDEMSKAVRHLAGPCGGTVGDLIDCTDRQMMYKVMLEERVFKTWHGGRIVLIGDACHKCVPFTGKGANESILDAVVLASLLYDMPSSRRNPSLPSFKNLDALQDVFNQYYSIRSSAAKHTVDMSGFFGSILIRNGWAGNIFRRVIFGLNSGWVGRNELDRIYYQRIQASFLPPVLNKGTSPCRPHVPSKRPIILHHQKSLEWQRGGGTGSGIETLVGGGSDDIMEDHETVDEFLTGPLSM